MAAMSMAAVFTGCGDDDDGNNNNPNPGPQIVAPADQAALTAQNKTYTVNIAGEAPITLRFPAAGQYEIVQGNTTETGTISGATRTDNSWTFTVSPTAGQQGAQEGVLRLDFTAGNAGTWTFTPTGGQAETGTFTVTEGSNGGTPGGGTPGGGTPGGTTGNPPNSITGQTLQLNYQPSGGEKFQFTSDTVLSYENGANAGTYTYDSTNRRINVTLDNGWGYEITLNDATNATVVFRQTPGGSADTQTASYTLQ